MERSFSNLKEHFTTAPILAHFDPQKLVIVEINASDFALGAILSQKNQETGRLYPIAFHSRKFSPAEINYEIHDKKLLAVVDTFKHWQQYLEGTQYQIQVFSNHQNLEYFTTTKVLNRRQVRRAQNLSVLILKSIISLGVKMANQMHCQGVRSTTLKKREVKINPLLLFYGLHILETLE